MQGLTQPYFFAVLMLQPGLGIPLMAALNGGLGSRLGSAPLATVVLLLVGLGFALSWLLATEGLPRNISAADTPWYYYFGGFFVVFYILSITWVAPRFGVSNAVSFVLLGQLIAMSLIDHYGFAGAPQYAFTLKRALGLVLMAVGVFMVLSRAQNV